MLSVFGLYPRFNTYLADVLKLEFNSFIDDNTSSAKGKLNVKMYNNLIDCDEVNFCYL